MMEERKFHNGPVVAIVHVEDKVWSYGQDRFILIWSPKVTTCDDVDVIEFLNCVTNHHH